LQSEGHQSVLNGKFLILLGGSRPSLQSTASFDRRLEVHYDASVARDCVLRKPGGFCGSLASSPDDSYANSLALAFGSLGNRDRLKAFASANASCGCLGNRSSNNIVGIYCGREILLRSTNTT
jgi:hypothetical protein